MIDDIFKKPEPPSAESYYGLMYSTKSEDELNEIVDSLSKATDAEMLNVIFKRCKYYQLRIRVGKMLYYSQS